MIKTIKDLKEIIKDLPDNMEIMGYKDGNGDLWRIDYWISAEETEDNPDGKPTLVISI